MMLTGGSSTGLLVELALPRRPGFNFWALAPAGPELSFLSLRFPAVFSGELWDFFIPAKVTKRLRGSG